MTADSPSHRSSDEISAHDRQPEVVEETMLIGYEEDGVMWVTAGSSTATPIAAERCLGRGWRVIADAWLRSTGEEANAEDDIWEECTPDSPGARPGWKLIDTRAEVILVDQAHYLNPHYGGVFDAKRPLTERRVTVEEEKISLGAMARWAPNREGA